MLYMNLAIYLCKLKFLLILQDTQTAEINYDFNQLKKSN